MPEKIITINKSGHWSWKVGDYYQGVGCPWCGGESCGDWCPHFSVETSEWQTFGKTGTVIENYIKLTCGTGRTIFGTIIDERFKE